MENIILFTFRSRVSHSFAMFGLLVGAQKAGKAGAQESTVDIPHLLMEGKVCLYYSCIISLSQCNFIDQVEM